MYDFSVSEIHEWESRVSGLETGASSPERSVNSAREELPDAVKMLARSAQGLDFLFWTILQPA
jgi:hypothetical protein